MARRRGPYRNTRPDTKHAPTDQGGAHGIFPLQAPLNRQRESTRGCQFAFVLLGGTTVFYCMHTMLAPNHATCPEQALVRGLFCAPALSEAQRPTGLSWCSQTCWQRGLPTGVGHAPSSQGKPQQNAAHANPVRAQQDGAVWLHSSTAPQRSHMPVQSGRTTDEYSLISSSWGSDGTITIAAQSNPAHGIRVSRCARAACTVAT